MATRSLLILVKARLVRILLECFLVFINNYRPQTKLREGNAFTGVCVQEGVGIIKCIMG